jgi:hypothetical protein
MSLQKKIKDLLMSIIPKSLTFQDMLAMSLEYSPKIYMAKHMVKSLKNAQKATSHEALNNQNKLNITPPPSPPISIPTTLKINN